MWPARAEEERLPAEERRRGTGDAATLEVIEAAIEDFNRGDQGALNARPRLAPAQARRPQLRLGCSPGHTCMSGRPIPLAVGSSELRITASRQLGDQRAVCNLATADGTRLVGVYAVDEGRITAACHYFSDMDMLDRMGILPMPADPTAAAETEAAGAPPLSLADGLLARRLARRRERVQLVIHALDQRVHALNDGGQPVPGALSAAIRGFQDELERINAEDPS